VINLTDNSDLVSPHTEERFDGPLEPEEEIGSLAYLVVGIVSGRTVVDQIGQLDTFDARGMTNVIEGIPNAFLPDLDQLPLTTGDSPRLIAPCQPDEVDCEVPNIPVALPEPRSVALQAAGLAALSALFRRRLARARRARQPEDRG
jgi:hypothetical protein